MLTATGAGEKLAAFTVNENGEWATVMLRFGTGGERWWGTLLVNSSFGAYGHSWSHCGCQFPKFLQEIDTDYLLGKIATKEPNEERMLASVRRQLLIMRRERLISADQASDAWHEIASIEEEGHHPQVTAHLLYIAAEMPDRFDWCDISSMDWPNDAKQFARKLWPSIAAKIGDLIEA